MNKVGSPTVERVLAGRLCSGCGLCASLSGDGIVMDESSGYARPVIGAGLTPEAEAAVAEACPGSRVAPWDGAPWNDAPETHLWWGPYHDVSTGWATDAEVRHEASSGGALSGLLLYALESGRVDRVLEIAADPDRPTRNRTVWSRTRDEVLAGAGSRYTASSPLADIDAALEQPGRFAFVGKPCDVSALRQLGRRDPRVAERVPLAFAFFCAGIPNHSGVDAILDDMGLGGETLESFRYRGQGWPGRARATTPDGRSAEMSYADSWGGRLSSRLQFRCKICPDAVGGVADVACADAWYGDEAGYPSFEEEAGRSLVVTRTRVGEDFVAEAVRAGALVRQPLPVDEIDAMQPGQANRKRLVRSRLTALDLTFKPKPQMQGLRVAEASRAADVRSKLKNTIGAVRRVATGRW